VLIESERRGRIFGIWQVMEAYSGKDGCVRVVWLKTAVVEMVRPVQRVYLLEVNTPVEVPQLNRKHTLHDVKHTSLVLRKTVTARSGKRVKCPSNFLYWGCIVWVICFTFNQRWEDVGCHDNFIFCLFKGTGGNTGREIGK
jgi:hypothetical protein